MLKSIHKKGQSGGIITGLVFGIAGLVIGVIIALVITSTLGGADLHTTTRTGGTVTDEAGWINTTTYTLAEASGSRTSYVITGALNTTDSQMLLAGNYSVDSNGVVTNASATEWEAITFNYTYENFSPEEQATNNLTGNFTEGINEISAKIPTVLLIAAIVLILSVLAILVLVWKRMNISGGSTI